MCRCGPPSVWGTVPRSRLHGRAVGFVVFPQKVVDHGRRYERTTKILSIWAAKGGVGASVTAAAVSVLACRDHGEAVLVDLYGDQAPILGLATTNAPGVFDWLGSRADRRESLERLAVPTSIGVHLLQPGTSDGWSPDRAEHLVGLLGSFDCPVVVDCGVRGSDPGPGRSTDGSGVDGLVGLLRASSRSILVSSSCYLAVRRAVHLLSEDRAGQPSGADGLVVVADPGRALTAADVASVTQLELLAAVERDPAVARCVDAGQFLSRPPRSLLRSMRDVL